MLTLTTLEKNKIQDFIGKTLKNSHLEFEAKIHNDVLRGTVYTKCV